MSIRDALLVGSVAICALIALRRPVFGMLTFVGLGLLNPHSLTWGLGRTLRLSLLVGLCTIIGYLFSSEPKRFPRSREAYLLLALWGVFAVSTVFAFYPALAFAKFVYLSKILVMTFLMTSLINTESRLRWLLRVMALSLSFYAFKGGLFAIMTGGDFRVYGPEDSFLAADNAIGLALAMSIPLLYYLAAVESRAWFRWFLRAMLIFAFPAVIATYSRGAWLGLAIVTIWLVLRSRYRFVVMTVGVLLALILLPALPHLLPEKVADRYDSLVNYQDDASAESRFWNWELCARVGLANPLTGGGFDFQSTEVYAKYMPEFLERWPGKEWSCHSVWLTLLGSQGIPGALLWIALILSLLFSLRRIRAYGKAHDGAAQLTSYADMLETAFLAFFVVGTFVDAAHFDMFYYLVGVVILLKDLIRREIDASSQPAVGALAPNRGG